MPFTRFLWIVGFQGALTQIVSLFLPLYFQDMGFSGLQTGIFFAVSGAANILFSLPMGVSTDRRSIVSILMLSFFLLAFSRVGLILSDSLAVFCVFAFIGSFGGRFYSTASTTLFFKITGSENRAQAGRFQFTSFLGMGLGMIAGGLIIARTSFRSVFIVSSVGYLAMIAAALLLPRNQTVKIEIQEYRKSVLTPQVLFLAFIFFLSSMHWGAENVAYTPFLKNVLHLTISQTGFFTGIGFLFVGLGALLGPVLLGRKVVKNLESILYLGFSMGGLFHILRCIPNVYVSFLFRAGHEIGDGLVFFAFYHGIAKIFNIDRIGGCAAFISLWMGAGQLLGSLAYGTIRDAAGPQPPLIISGVVLLALPVLLRTRGKARLYAPKEVPVA